LPSPVSLPCVLASAILITTSEEIADKTIAEIERQKESLSRKAIIDQSLDNYGAVIIAAIFNSGTAHYAGTLSIAIISTQFQQEMGIGLGQYCAFMLLYNIVGCFTGPSIILGCVSLGQLYTRHRILGAILAYFIVTMIMQFVTYIAMLPTYSKLIVASASGKTLSMMNIMMPTFIIIFVITIIIAIAMYFINIHMMTSKLNLE